MTEIKNTKTARDPPDRADIRTLQALDQAAGGSGDVTRELATGASAAQEIPPQPGTDDARCEDSAECDRRRREEVDEIFFRISELRSGPQSQHERADAEIRAEIESRLKADGLLDTAGIFVTVSRGRVIIEGSVENHEAKQRAEAISRQAGGIVGHDSNLAVRKTR
ncbi:MULTISPECIES: BON domain-containing protein [unclassified Rhizobium]|uniref:BON domain-containing protein n=1 Tax=unclassified Rhizobium TaxID=2613769 RepID=UPI000EA8CB4D|nr:MULTISPECIES: BON domain-containing protein [unclassified Rhizobium]AYG69208.1 BON domain-containing protein [Rhizobium sp. CCGE531]AYG75588.1 BON domain-containing protein [Rhizobium sp. CCGE532]